jgi:phosphatidylinositol alpha-1,6-mannosyltransferase
MTVTPLFWLLARWSKPRLIVTSQVLFSGLGALLCSRVFGIPFLVVAHGEDVGEYLKAPYGLKAKLAHAVLENARVVVCNSRNTEDLVKRFCLPGSPATRVISPCVNPDEAGADPAEVEELRRDLHATGPLVLSVGRLQATRKGFDVAIKALKTVRAAVPGATLAIVGPGDQSRLKNLAREEGVADAVRFLGPVSRSTLLGLYSLCDVFLLPVRTLPDGDQEGFGIVFLEAGLHAKPVVAGRSGGSCEAVVDGETGILVDGVDPVAVASAVRRLLTDTRLAAAVGEAGRRRVLEDFNSKKRGALFESLLEDVAG